MPKIDYKKSGVNYDFMDPFKILAQKAGKATDKNVKWSGLKPLPETRGESCFLFNAGDHYLAHVTEGLGTKNVIADEMYRLTKKSYYANVAIDTVSTIVNDLITLGALPVSISMFMAVGDSAWFKDQKRVRDLVNGWKKACDLCGAAWSGGETQTLKGIVEKDGALFGGSALGTIKPKKHLIKSNLKSGDRIILLESSGIQTNGATLAREVAKKLPKGFKTPIPGGRTFGAALLDASRIYVPVIRDCQKSGIPLHYTAHITGHGWRKIMRSDQKFSYIIEHMPKVPPVFAFLQKHAGLSDREMYATFNMGAGFALFTSARYAEKILSICKKHKIKAVDAGYLKASKTKEVTILPLDIHYKSNSLKLR